MRSRHLVDPETFAALDEAPELVSSATNPGRDPGSRAPAARTLAERHRIRAHRSGRGRQSGHPHAHRYTGRGRGGRAGAASSVPFSLSVSQGLSLFNS
jgi:hypothetical protein